MRALDPITETKHSGWREHWVRFAILLIAVIVVLGIGARLWTRLELRHVAGDEAIPTVAVAQVKPGSNNEELVLPGNVQPYATAPIYARTSGYVRRWLVDLGTPVKQGQLLAELDTPEVDQQLSQAEADLRTAEANDGLARSTAERWGALLKTDSVSKQDADEKISDYKSKQAAAESARANLHRLQDLQNFKRIVAPFDGTVTVRNLDVGQLVNTGGGAELFRISQLNKLRVFVQVPEPSASGMHVGLQAGLHFAAHPDKNYPATVVRTAEALDPTIRTLLTELEIDNPKGELFPGAYTEVHFQLSPGQNIVRIPANALIFRGEGLLVATPTPDDHIHMQPVTVGRDFGTELEVITGLEPGSKVVLNPPDSLEDNQLVRVSAPAPKEGTPAPNAAAHP